MKNILLTGNNGYIGPIMTKLLKKESYHVAGLDINWFTGNEFFPLTDEYKPHKQIVKDIRHVNADDLKGIDCVIHLAGLSNDPLGEINMGITEEINFTAGMKFAVLCKANGIERFIFASSCSIYGISGSGKEITEEGQLNPITAYARAKVNTEKGLSELAGVGFHPVFMRNATVYGLSPRLRLDLVVNNLLAGACLTGQICVMSDGTPWRPIVHIEDFCRASIAALKAKAEKVHCQAFNVGINEENYQVKDIAAEIQKALPDSRVQIMNKTGVDERTYRVDFTKINKILPDFKPQWNLKKGIIELLEAYKKFGLSLGDLESDKYFRVRTLKSLIKSEKIDNEFSWKGNKA